MQAYWTVNDTVMLNELTLVDVTFQGNYSSFNKMYFQKISKIVLSKYPYCFFLLLLLLIHNTCLAQKLITVSGTTVISTPTTITNVTLNLDQGAFLITNNASLDIENCIINVTMSPTNPYFIFLKTGSLTLKNNVVKITSSNLPLTPLVQSLFYAIQIQQATNVNIIGNQFSVNKYFTIGWFLTYQEFNTTGFNISNNKITNFHGGVYLINSKNGLISHNIFSHISFGNIFVSGNDCIITANTIINSGNNNVGDGIDIIDSDTVTISDNFIGISSCYSILILRAKNLLINNNIIVGGITYGIYIAPNLGFAVDNPSLRTIITNDKFKVSINQNITITNNYLGQNRFGLGAVNVDTLSVHNNSFVQKFNDAPTRIFWTDNTNLLIQVINLTWHNNFYKEAYTQFNVADSSRSQIFVPFPVTGGVVLPP